MLNLYIQDLALEATKTLKRVNLILEELHRGDIQIEKHVVGAEANRRATWYVKKARS